MLIENSLIGKLWISQNNSDSNQPVPFSFYILVLWKYCIKSKTIKSTNFWQILHLVVVEKYFDNPFYNFWRKLILREHVDCWSGQVCLFLPQTELKIKEDKSLLKMHLKPLGYACRKILRDYFRFFSKSPFLGNPR